MPIRRILGNRFSQGTRVAWNGGVNRKLSGEYLISKEEEGGVIKVYNKRNGEHDARISDLKIIE